MARILLIILLFNIILMNLQGCKRDTKVDVVALTHLPTGHTLHHNSVFSKDNKWLVFDGRNQDTDIAATSTIGILNMETRKESVIYRTVHPTKYGPGVGAASFSPVKDRVIFIHGLRDASQEKPYTFTRRTGVAIDIDHPFYPLNMDARDMTYPYTKGSLRGGTHSHCWSPDGALISFTYNNEGNDSDLRTEGVMFKTTQPIEVDKTEENNNGEMYAALVAHVVRNPRPGSDEIDKAFDECWIGENGYVNSEGKHIKHAIAFQGTTRDENGKTVTEIYVVDVDTANILADVYHDTAGAFPSLSAGTSQRRVSRTEDGLSASVRSWLRSSKDGAFIYGLANDENGLPQIISCAVNSGKIKYITDMKTPVDHPFNLNKAGNLLAFVSGNDIFIINLKTGILSQLTENKETAPPIAGAPLFSPDGNWLVFNQYQPANGNLFLQIMGIAIKNKRF